MVPAARDSSYWVPWSTKVKLFTSGPPSEPQGLQDSPGQATHPPVPLLARLTVNTLICHDFPYTVYPRKSFAHEIVREALSNLESQNTPPSLSRTVQGLDDAGMCLFKFFPITRETDLNCLVRLPPSLRSCPGLWNFAPLPKHKTSVFSSFLFSYFSLFPVSLSPVF